MELRRTDAAVRATPVLEESLAPPKLTVISLHSICGDRTAARSVSLPAPERPAMRCWAGASIGKRARTDGRVLPATKGKDTKGTGQARGKLSVWHHLQRRERSQALYFDSWEIGLVYNMLSGLRGCGAAHSALRNAELLTMWAGGISTKRLHVLNDRCGEILAVWLVLARRGDGGDAPTCSAAHPPRRRTLL